MKKIIIATALLALTATSAFATRAGFRVYNRSGQAVQKILVAPTYSSRYGSTDLLGDRILRPGSSIWVDPGLTDDSQNECLLDVIAIGVDGGKWEKRCDVCENSEWNLLGPAGRKIQ